MDTPSTWQVADDDSGKRVDAYLTEALQRMEMQISRATVRRAIDASGILVDGKQVKPSLKVSPGQTIEIVQLEVPREGPEPEPIPLDILFEDDHLAVINKPPGMVVHPAKGHWSGTLTSALAYHFQSLSSCGGPTRPGIVHRLDRDTSGVIIVAKNDSAHTHLASQFQNRTVNKLYLAIVKGTPDRDRDWIDQPIGPHPKYRERKAIRPDHPDSREAQTFYEVVERFDGYALVNAKPKTGRTHQIRIHLASIGCHVVCDKLYGKPANPASPAALITRQALHARRIEFSHPTTNEPLSVEAPVPEDMAGVLDALRAM